MTVPQIASGLRARAFGCRLAGCRASTAAPWLGLLLVFAFSCLTVDRAGPAPVERNWVFGRLNREHTFGQTFVATPGQLVAIRVLLFANSSDRDDPVTLRLRYANSDLPDLAVATLPLRALDRRDWTTFPISPLTLGLTSSLRLELAAPTLPATDWIIIMAGRDTYSGGELLHDDAPHAAADLAFQPVYRQRWIDWLLPITRMARAKPDLFGWPPLYALLTYTCCMAAAYLLLAIWRDIGHG